MNFALAFGVAFVVMEPVTALVHRFVMHGFGFKLHQSHHASRGAGFELNDLYPVIFAALTIAVMAVGVSGGDRGLLLPATLGITAYGAAYGFVHEIYIHQRIKFSVRIGVFERMKEAHRIHHVWSQAPYGMLVPMVPSALRSRAQASTYDPFGPTEGTVTVV